MTELRDRFFGNTIEERVRSVPAEIAVDAVGLWQIVSFGREGFGLDGDALVDYVDGTWSLCLQTAHGR